MFRKTVRWLPLLAAEICAGILEMPLPACTKTRELEPLPGAMGSKSKGKGLGTGRVDLSPGCGLRCVPKAEPNELTDHRLRSREMGFSDYL